jgi:hypothetical protein
MDRRWLSIRANVAGPQREPKKRDKPSELMESRRLAT